MKTFVKCMGPEFPFLRHLFKNVGKCGKTDKRTGKTENDKIFVTIY